MTITKEQFVKYVDHSLLKPFLTQQEVVEGILYAKELECASVCLSPQNVSLAQKMLKGTKVKVGTVVGFPSGAHTTFTKVTEAKDAYTNGAEELDMVINIGALRAREYQKVQKEIEAVVHATPAMVKVILENAYLTKEEIQKGAELTEAAGAAFVKTSTGFAPTGSTVEDLQIMRAAVSDKVKIKAAGGLNTLEECLDAITAGAERIGISRTKEILSEF